MKYRAPLIAANSQNLSVFFQYNHPAMTLRVAIDVPRGSCQCSVYARVTRYAVDLSGGHFAMHHQKILV
jgi:hypothetical protein